MFAAFSALIFIVEVYSAAVKPEHAVSVFYDLTIPAFGATGEVGAAVLGGTGEGRATVLGATGEGGATVLGATGEGGATVLGATGEGGATVLGATSEGGATVLGATDEVGAAVLGATGEGRADVLGATGESRKYRLCYWRLDEMEGSGLKDKSSLVGDPFYDLYTWYSTTERKYPKLMVGVPYYGLQYTMGGSEWKNPYRRQTVLARLAVLLPDETKLLQEIQKWIESRGATDEGGTTVLGATGEGGFTVLGATGEGRSAVLEATGEQGTSVIGANGEGSATVLGATGEGGATVLGATGKGGAAVLEETGEGRAAVLGATGESNMHQVCIWYVKEMVGGIKYESRSGPRVYVLYTLSEAERLKDELMVGIPFYIRLYAMSQAQMNRFPSNDDQCVNEWSLHGSKEYIRNNPIERHPNAKYRN